MLGDDLRNWFEMFDGMIVYRPNSAGGHSSDGWISWKDIEGRFSSGKLLFAGRPYSAQNHGQREELLNAIVAYAGTFVLLRLLERRRQISPPSLDYRLTSLGRRVGNWGYGPQPGFRKKAFFFIAAILLRAYKYRAVIAIGAAGWAVLNAARFYTAAFSWLEGRPFAVWSGVAVAALIAGWALVKRKLE